MEPTNAVALMLLVFVFMDQINMILYWKKWSIALLRPLLLWSIIGLFFGWLSFDLLDATIIKLLMVGIVVAFWLLPLLTKPLLLPVSSQKKGIVWKIATVIAGSSAGFSSFVANAGGPPLIAYLVKATSNKALFQGCSVFFFWWINLAKLPIFISLDLYPYETLSLAVQMIPVAIVGLIVSLLVNKYISEKHFRYFVPTLLLVAVLHLLYSGVTDLLTRY